MTIEGNCKINLALNVEGKLPNGYHRVKMIMQEISLCDKISLTFGKSGASLSCSSSEIPTDNRNIALRAACLFYTETGIEDGVHIHIEKHIPSQAGLGGGSADGAAVLKAMNEHYGFPVSQADLLSMGARLGADVPFCILGGTALAEGIGEVLTPLNSRIKKELLIVKPLGGVSTPWAYSRLDEMGFESVDVEKVKHALEKGDLDALCRSMGNVFEAVAAEAVPDVYSIKKELLRHGAVGAMMSGSGTAVFGIFDTVGERDAAYAYFKPLYEQTYKAAMV